MKKYIAIILTACMALGVSACSNETNNANNSNSTSTSSTNNTSSGNNSLLDGEYFDYGTKALEAVDKYLDVEMEKEEVLSTLTALIERVGESEDYGIGTLWAILSLLQMTLDDNPPDFYIDDVKEYRDDLAFLLDSPLRYRDTTRKTLNITSKDFFEAMNTALEAIDSSLVLNDFSKVETEDEKYIDTACYSTIKNGVNVTYIVDKKTDKLITLRFVADLDNPSEKELQNLVSYWGITIGILNHVSDTDNDTVIKELKLDDLFNEGSEEYKNDKVEYTKSIYNNNYFFYVKS